MLESANNSLKTCLRCLGLKCHFGDIDQAAYFTLFRRFQGVFWACLVLKGEVVRKSRARV